MQIGVSIRLLRSLIKICVTYKARHADDKHPKLYRHYERRKKESATFIANGEIPTSELWINVIISVSRIVSLAVSACNVVINILHEAKTSGLIFNIMRMRMLQTNCENEPIHMDTINKNSLS